MVKNIAKAEDAFQKRVTKGLCVQEELYLEARFPIVGR